MGMKVFSSAKNFVAVTPSDTTTLKCKAIYAGSNGNIAVARGSSDTAVTFVGVVQGSFLPIELIDGRIMATNTTCTNIIAVDW